LIGNKKLNEEFSLQHVIAHEHLHKWFGGKLKQKPKDQVNNGWFIEEFTDYYTNYINYKYGLWDLDQYLEDYNSSLREFFTNDYGKFIIKDLNNYYHNPPQLLYKIGVIIAHEINQKIKTHTNSKMNLDDYIVRLMQFVGNNKDFLFSSKIFSTTLKDFIGLDNSESLLENIPISSLQVKAKEILEGKAKLLYNKIQIPNYGFDLFNSALDMKIKNLNKNSELYKNGVRNGYTIDGIWYPNKQDLILTINVRINNTIQTIKIEPVYIEKTIAQYTILIYR